MCELHASSAFKRFDWFFLCAVHSSIRPLAENLLSKKIGILLILCAKKAMGGWSVQHGNHFAINHYDDINRQKGENKSQSNLGSWFQIHNRTQCLLATSSEGVFSVYALFGIRRFFLSFLRFDRICFSGLWYKINIHIINAPVEESSRYTRSHPKHWGSGAKMHEHAVDKSWLRFYFRSIPYIQK